MPYKTGSWGIQAKERYERRKGYFQSLRKKGIGETIGHLGEIEAKTILSGCKSHSKKIDFEWNGNLVDVKTSSLIVKTHKDKYYNCWKFWLKIQRSLCDYYLLLCKDKENLTKYIFLVPEKDIKKSSLIISESKLYKFQKYAFKGGKL